MAASAASDRRAPNERLRLIRHVTDTVLSPTYKFPTLPGTAADIMRLANAPDTAFRDVDRVVRRDPLIAARVLAVANSSAFSATPRVMSLRTSMMVLGWHNLRDVLWQVVAESHVFRASGHRRYLQQMRLHGVATAHITRMICRDLEVDSEQAFVCGLLHDMGRPLALQILSDMRLDDETSADILRAVHGEIGARIARAWKLPAAVAHVAADHHNEDGAPGPAPTDAAPPMARIVAAAERIADHHGLGASTETLDLDDARVGTLFARIGLSRAQVEELVANTEDLSSRIL